MDNFSSPSKLGNEPENDGLDELVQLFDCLPKPKAVIINPLKYEKVMKTAEAFDVLLKEYETEATVTVHFNPVFLTGTVVVDITDCTELNPQFFATVVSLADNFEIYWLTNGNFRIELTFQKVFNGIY